MNWQRVVKCIFCHAQTNKGSHLNIPLPSFSTIVPSLNQISEVNVLPGSCNCDWNTHNINHETVHQRHCSQKNFHLHDLSGSLFFLKFHIGGFHLSSSVSLWALVPRLTIFSRSFTETTDRKKRYSSEGLCVTMIRTHQRCQTKATRRITFEYGTHLPI